MKDQSMPRLAIAIGVLSIMSLSQSTAHAQALHTGNAPTAEQLVDGLNATFGRHAQMRASHAKGTCATGTFEPATGARNFSSSPLFSSGTLPATVRFSIAGGNPKVSDKAVTARGMALELDLPNGERMALVMLSTPAFFATSGESFLDFLAARRPDPATGKPDPKALELSAANHLDSEAQRRWLAAVPPAASYATAPYFAVHTYYFTKDDGSEQAARWRLEPEAGRIGLSGDELKAKADDYLSTELAERLKKGPAAWRVIVMLPEATDPLLNVTAAWPDTRKEVELGRLIVTGIATGETAATCDGHVFDPANLATGIMPPRDAIFAVRSEAYAISASRRAE